jgi:hypothetical protein
MERQIPAAVVVARMFVLADLQITVVTAGLVLLLFLFQARQPQQQALQL